MVIPHRERPKLAGEPMAAFIILSAGTDTVPAPIPQGTYNLMEQWVAGIDRAALAHGDMMGRIKTGCADIPNRSCLAPNAVQVIFRSQSIAVVFDQP